MKIKYLPAIVFITLAVFLTAFIVAIMFFQN